MRKSSEEHVEAHELESENENNNNELASHVSMAVIL